MKKLLIATVSAVALMGLAACSDSTDNTTTQSVPQSDATQDQPVTPAPPATDDTTTQGITPTPETGTGGDMQNSAPEQPPGSVKSQRFRAGRPASPGLSSFQVAMRAQRPTMTVSMTARAKTRVSTGHRFAEQQRRDGQRDEGLQQLHLADAGDAADRQADIPGEEAKKHRAEAEIEEGRALRGRRLSRTRLPSEKIVPTSENGAVTIERPADDLPARHLARQPAGDDVAEADENSGEEQPEIAGRKLHAAVAQGEGDDEGGPATPQIQNRIEGRSPAIRAAKDAGGERQDTEHDGAMRGRHGLHGERGQQRKGKDQQHSGKEKGAEVAARKAPAQEDEDDGGGGGSERGAAEGYEQGIEGTERDAGRRQRAAEDDDADEADGEAGVFAQHRGLVGEAV